MAIYEQLASHLASYHEYALQGSSIPKSSISMGLAGAPRRYYNYSVYEEFDQGALDMMMDLNVIVTFFAIFAALGQALFLFNFFYSIFRGPKAP